MMGSKEEDVPNEPKQKPIFVEDMNEDELASAVSFKMLLAMFCFITFASLWISA